MTQDQKYLHAAGKAFYLRYGSSPRKMTSRAHLSARLRLSAPLKGSL